jgi:hypothetical protein
MGLLADPQLPRRILPSYSCFQPRDCVLRAGVWSEGFSRELSLCRLQPGGAKRPNPANLFLPIAPGPGASPHLSRIRCTTTLRLASSLHSNPRQIYIHAYIHTYIASSSLVIFYAPLDIKLPFLIVLPSTWCPPLTLPHSTTPVHRQIKSQLDPALHVHIDQRCQHAFRQTSLDDR